MKEFGNVRYLSQGEGRKLVEAIRNAMKLRHEHVVAHIGFDFVHAAEDSFLQFLELLDGTLRQYLDDEGTEMGERLLVNVVKQVALGLEYIHSQHVIHRDLKGLKC